MTLEGRGILKEGWLTLFKSRRTGLFNNKPAPNKQLERGWAVIYNVPNPSRSLCIIFYQDNLRGKPIMKKEKIELAAVRCVTQMFNHPKHPNSFTLSMKGSKKVILNADNTHDLMVWLKVVCDICHLEYRTEKVIWEYYDGGLWNSATNSQSFSIEGHYCDGENNFTLDEQQVLFSYNLSHMTKTHPRTRAVHRIKRTPFLEDRHEVFQQNMLDLPAFWEWCEESDFWHPFERETNIQIEDMYDSGSQWAELTLCLPSPMPFLLDLHDMKLVNFRTAVRYNLRRIDNENFQQASTIPQPRSPSPDDFDQPPQPNMMSPMAPLFRPIQECLQHFQVPRSNITYRNMLGEGAFGDVFLASVLGLPGFGENPAEVAVKQLRLSDFIARHGHHTQQMEDFLREAKEMSKVDYHRVVKLIAVCTLDYPLLLIEEYMNLGDLLGVLKDSRPYMAIQTQLTFAQQVADGMDYLSTTLNCVHRDLAARNILVNKNDEGSMHAKVADFGLTRHLYSDMYKTQGSKPRPLPAKWMALESLMYFVFTTKSDVWSYGVLLWEIMSLGNTPYPGVENRELLEQIEERGLKLNKPKTCPTPVYHLTLDCIQHDVEKRPFFKEIITRLDNLTALLDKGELLVATDNGPTSPVALAPPSSGSDVGNSEVDTVRETKKKEKKIEEEETIGGHTYTIVNRDYKRRNRSDALINYTASIGNDASKKDLTQIEENEALSPLHEPPTIPFPLECGNGNEEGGGATAMCDPPKTRRESTSIKEFTQGHLYYLLDPKEEKPHLSPVSSTSPHNTPIIHTTPPPLPDHHPRSNSCSPSHTPSSNGRSCDALNSGRHSPLVVSARPKAFTISDHSRNDKVDIGLKLKTVSLNRSSDTRQ